ncbi:MAG: Crp/Fnr family transcriptional regulator [Hyphomicrobiaceae bacterium]
MDREELVRVLGEVAAFEGLPTMTLKAVAGEMRPAGFTAGQSIFSRGDTGQELYVVLKGRVRLSVLTLEGRELSFTHATEGQMFGEIAMLDGGPRTADATAVNAVEAASLGQPQLRRLMAADPELAMALIRCLCGRLREADMQLEGVALHRIEVRLARYLIGLARQRKPGTEAGIVEVDLAMSQSELALLVGASRPKVNGALVALEEQGAITRSDSRLKCDLAVLGEIAELG